MQLPTWPRQAKDWLRLLRRSIFGQADAGRCTGGVRHQLAPSINIRLSKESLQMFELSRLKKGHDPSYGKCGHIDGGVEY